MKSKNVARLDTARIPATFLQTGAPRFWLAALCIGIGTGLGAILLGKLLEIVQHLAWAGSGANILKAASRAGTWRHILVLLSAGILVAVAQFGLARLSSGSGIEITSAIWFTEGRVPLWRTLGSAVLSIMVVGMGASLGREGAPKETGAVVANVVSDQTRLSAEQRRLLVACGAGAGMAAAYGVPLGGALFALEVLRGILSLRLVLPALLISVVATEISWIALPNEATYNIPACSNAVASLAWALFVGPIAGLAAVGYVRAIGWATHRKPKGYYRFAAPVVVLGLLGVASVTFPQILGNGSDLSQLLFTGGIPSAALLLVLLVLKPAATVMCLQSGTPGGLFTPSLTFGALLGSVLGCAGAQLGLKIPLGLSAVLGAGAMLAATTQGPISAVVLMLELTGRDRSIMGPLLLVVISATLVSRLVETRSIYEAKLSDQEVKERLAAREPSAS